MPRTVYVIPADADPDEHAAAAAGEGADELAVGISPALADRFPELEPDDLPVALELPDPPVPAVDPGELELVELEQQLAGVESELVAMFETVAAGGTLSAADKGKIPDLAVRALGGRAKVDRLRGRPSSP